MDLSRRKSELLLGYVSGGRGVQLKEFERVARISYMILSVDLRCIYYTLRQR